MTADLKPPKRIRDSDVFAIFHGRGWSCLCCGRDWPIDGHHILHRSQGGDDVIANLAPLCQQCHDAYHGHAYERDNQRITSEIVRASVARYVRSEEGADAAAYLISRLGAIPAEAYVLRLEGRL